MESSQNNFARVYVEGDPYIVNVSQIQYIKCNDTEDDIYGIYFTGRTKPLLVEDISEIYQDDEESVVAGYTDNSIPRY